MKNTLKLTYRCLVVGVGIAGLILHSGLLSGNLRTNMFIYYTNLSNLVAIVCFILLIIQQLLKRESASLTWFKGMTSAIILLTFFTYHFVLLPLILENPDYFTGSVELGNVSAPGNIIVHYILPWLCILDGLLFDTPRMVYTWKDPLKWALGPLVYWVFGMLHGWTGGIIEGTQSRFPYPFMDVDQLGWSKVGLYSLIVLIVFLLLSYLYIGMHALARRLKQKSVSR